MRPHYSQSNRKNATPSSDTSQLASNGTPRDHVFTVSYNLGQNRCEICTPPLPQIKDGKMERFGFCAASYLIW